MFGEKVVLRRRFVALTSLALLAIATLSPASWASAATLSETKVTDLKAQEVALADIILTWDAPLAVAGVITDYKITLDYPGSQKVLVVKDPVSSKTGVTITDYPLGTNLKIGVRPVAGKKLGNASYINVASPKPDPIASLSAPVQAQMTYVKAHFKDKSRTTWGYIPSYNCANFASQSLIARGYKQTSKWHNRMGSTWSVSRTWVSSTALSKFVKSFAGSQQISYANRTQVQVGDLVFFDWDRSGDRDHSAVVTTILTTVSGPKIYYASHTAHGLFQSVVVATTLLHPGGKVYFVHPGEQ